MTATRDTSFDSIKYILIACVVFGHTFQLGMEGLNEKLFTFINSFHMPAFIIISGYFYKDSDWRKFWKSNLELLLVMLIFQVLLFTKGVGWTDPFDFSLGCIGDSITHLYKPKAAMWYLLSLVWWRIMMRCTLPLWRDNVLVMMPLCVILALVVGFIPVGTAFSFQRTFFFFPFFLLGYYLKQKQVWSKIRNVKKWYSLGIIAFYFLIICLIPNFPDSVLTGSFHYKCGLASWKTLIALRAACYLWMLPLALSVLNIIPDKSFFAVKGKDTLFYLLFHPFFIRLMYYGVQHLQLPTNSLCLLLYTVVSMFIMYWMTKIPFLYFLTKPISFKSKK